MTAQRLVVALGLSAAVLYTFITPPFQVPDEVGHFWRALTIARGDVVPRVETAGGVSEVEQGLSTIVFVFYRPIAGRLDQKITRTQFETSRFVRLEPEKRAKVTFPAGYTAVPYIPQIAASLLTRLIPTRPLVTFYLGRLLNALAYIGIVAYAVHITPLFRWVFVAAALLPMSLYLAASWSADAITIALAFLFTAQLLRGARTPREVAFAAVTGALVGLCKPAYFLIALLAWSGLRRSAAAVVTAATAAGVLVSLWVASHAPAPVRPDAVVDARAQIQCLRDQPLDFVSAFAHELNFDYVRQAIGRLGMLDVALPEPLIWIELALLVLCAWSDVISWPVRASAVAISICTIGGIALASYIGWTPPCARVIDGLQGRYLLPIVPLLLMIISARLITRERATGIAVAAVGAAANLVALYAVAARYYW